MQKYTDAELIASYLSGDGNQFLAELFNRHNGVLYRAALRIMVDPSAAEDIVQSVFCKMISNMHHYKSELGGGSAIGWLLQSVIRESYNQKKSEKSRFNREKKIMSEKIQKSHQRNEDLKETIENHLNKLPEIYKAPITLQIMEGLSIKEISEALKIPEKTIRSQIARGLEKMKVSLQGVGITASAGSLSDILSNIHKPFAPESLNSKNLLNSIFKSKDASDSINAADFPSKQTYFKNAVVFICILVFSIGAIVVSHAIFKNLNNTYLQKKEIKQIACHTWYFENTKDLNEYQNIGLVKGVISIEQGNGVDHSNGLKVDDETVLEIDISEFKLPIKISYVTKFFIPSINGGQAIIKSNFEEKKIYYMKQLSDMNVVKKTQDYSDYWATHLSYIDQNSIDFWYNNKRYQYMQAESKDNKKVYFFINGKAVIDNLTIESIDAGSMPNKRNCEKALAAITIKEGVKKYELDKNLLDLPSSSQAKPFLIVTDPISVEKELDFKSNTIIYPSFDENKKVSWNKSKY